MRTVPYLAAVIALSLLAVLVLTRPRTAATVALSQAPQTLSVEDMQRSIDLTKLPVEDVKEPF